MSKNKTQQNAVYKIVFLWMF